MSTSAPRLARDVPVLVTDACSDVSDAFIHFLAQTVHCPVTAVVDQTQSSPEWEASMNKIGVQVHHLGRFHLHAEKRQLVAAHPRVFLYAMNRLHLVDTKRGERPQSTAPIAAELSSWIQACHEEKAEHVLYISTASPSHFLSTLDGCMERIHAPLEAQLQSTAAGIRHFTILRPVSLMSIRVPTRVVCGWEEPTKVFGRVDASIPQQLIAPDDVAHIAIHCLTHPFPQPRIIELAADTLSPVQEVQVRSAVLRVPARCSIDDRWLTPQLATRPHVSVEATRGMRPDLMSYKAWFERKMKVWLEQSREGGGGHRDDAMVQKKSVGGMMLMPSMSRVHRKSV